MGRRCGPNCSARSSLLSRACPLRALCWPTLLPSMTLPAVLQPLSSIDLCGRLVVFFIRGLAAASRWALQLVVLSVLSLLNGCEAAPVPSPPPLSPPWPQRMPMTVAALALTFFVIIALATCWADTTAVAHSGCGCCSAVFPPPRQHRLIRRLLPPPSPPPMVAEAEDLELEVALAALRASSFVQRVDQLRQPRPGSCAFLWPAVAGLPGVRRSEQVRPQP
jgi:hypothetical protein